MSDMSTPDQIVARARPSWKQIRQATREGLPPEYIVNLVILYRDNTLRRRGTKKKR